MHTHVVTRNGGFYSNLYTQTLAPGNAYVYIGLGNASVYIGLGNAYVYICPGNTYVPIY